MHLASGDVLRTEPVGKGWLGSILNLRERPRLEPTDGLLGTAVRESIMKHTDRHGAGHADSLLAKRGPYQTLGVCSMPWLEP